MLATLRRITSRRALVFAGGKGNGKREREESIQRERVELIQRVVVTKVPRLVGLQTATIVLIVTNPSPGRLEEPRCWCRGRWVGVQKLLSAPCQAGWLVCWERCCWTLKVVGRLVWELSDAENFVASRNWLLDVKDPALTPRCRTANSVPLRQFRGVCNSALLWQFRGVCKHALDVSGILWSGDI